MYSVKILMGLETCIDRMTIGIKAISIDSDEPVPLGVPNPRTTLARKTIILKFILTSCVIL